LSVPLVSVIIPTRSRAPLLKDAIESVLAVKRDGFELEVLVVDDGSTDNSVEVASRYPITVIQTEQLGVSMARNTGIAAAHGEYVAFLDDDDMWMPHNIAPQVRLLQEHPEYGGAYAQFLLTTPDRTPYGSPQPPLPLSSGWIFESILSHFPQLGTAVVRRAVAVTSGGLDPSLKAGEDWDWLLRIARHYPLGRIEQPVVLFRQRGRIDDELIWRRFPDMYRVFRRHTRRFHLWDRLRLQRILWRHRGWYMSIFLIHAKRHWQEGDRGRALRSLTFAVRTSPPHLLLTLLRSGWNLT
jgi:glycosyltransferase involved in cell wall biosynthesis